MRRLLTIQDYLSERESLQLFLLIKQALPTPIAIRALRLPHSAVRRLRKLGYIVTESLEREPRRWKVAHHARETMPAVVTRALSSRDVVSSSAGPTMASVSSCDGSPMAAVIWFSAPPNAIIPRQIFDT